MRPPLVAVGVEAHLVGGEVATPGPGAVARFGWLAARRGFSMQMQCGALCFGSLHGDGWRKALPETSLPFVGAMVCDSVWSIQPCHFEWLRE